MRLQGKTALVTAAGQGIGRATALAMAADALAGGGDEGGLSLESHGVCVL